MFRLFPMKFDPAALTPLTAQGWAQLVEGAEVLVARRDGRAKVVMTADGRIAKQISAEPCGGVFDTEPRALRFVRHIERLRAMGERVPSVETAYALANGKQHVLVYEPLPGESLRGAAADPARAPELLQTFARSLARLHDKGVLFRAGHLANYIVTPEGELGLIDVHALRFASGSAGVFGRARAFRILVKEDEDRQFLASAGGVSGFLDRYLSESKLGALRGRLLRLMVWLMHPPARAAW